MSEEENRRRVPQRFVDEHFRLLSSQTLKCPVVLANVRLRFHNSCQDAASSCSSILVYQ